MSGFNHSPRFEPGPSRKVSKDQTIERFENKYIIHPTLVPGIRKFIKPFCIADPNGTGKIPEYVVTTMQLDTPSHDLVLAKERKAFSRFKLRIRTYGENRRPDDPVFFEIKRKIAGVIIKSRAKMKMAQYTPEMFTDPEKIPRLNTPKDQSNLHEFIRLTREVNAKPEMLIRYIRESYFGANDDYARVTFDRRICYRPSRDWMLPESELKQRRYWRAMDTQTGLRRNFSGYVFELKSMRDAPSWMLELIERFSLTSTGFSKYAAAYRLENLFQLGEYTSTGESVSVR